MGFEKGVRFDHPTMGVKLKWMKKWTFLMEEIVKIKAQSLAVIAYEWTSSSSVWMKPGVCEGSI